MKHTTKETAIRYAKEQKKRTRVITGTWHGERMYFTESGSHRLDLGGNERLVFDNKLR